MIYITGDVHQSHDIGKLNTKNWPEQKTLTRDDYLIVCGDMGIVWDDSQSDRYWRDWFEDKPFTTLFVDGNHENHRLLQTYPVDEWNGGKIHKIRPHVYHLMRGQVFDIAGLKVFTMGGASSHDKEWRTEGFSWWPEELPSNAEYDEAMKNLEANNWEVDLVVSHCVADSIMKRLQWWYESDKLTNFFEAVVKERLSYSLWCFGHYHQDKVVDDHHVALYQKIRPISVES